MSLEPTAAERVARASADLGMGLPMVLTGPERDTLVMAAETARAPRLAAIGPATLALTRWRAQTLRLRAYDGDLARVAVPADAGVDWLRAMADPALDLATPLKGPFRELRGGDARPARAALRLAKRARLLPAAVLADGTHAPAALTRVSEGDLDLATPLQEVAGARVPLAGAPATRLRLFRTPDGAEEHAAVEIGGADRAAPVLARLHSACFTGDVLGSLKCDCGPQLRAAVAAMAAEGAGVLLYLDQEGRGIGLANKLRAYALQDQGFDTVEANHRLGFEDDERDFRIGAAILRAMGVGAVRLMTNNPAKVARLRAEGIAVAERVPLAVGRGPENAAYLAAKAAKSGHLL